MAFLCRFARIPTATLLQVIFLTLCSSLLNNYSQAFSLLPSAGTTGITTTTTRTRTTTTTTSLSAVGALVRKAKEASLREYVQGGMEDEVMQVYEQMKERMAATTAEETCIPSTPTTMGPLQQELTRRKGTITVIAEYKRKLMDSGYIQDIFEPGLLSNEFREFGASAMAVMADERMGGCSYQDLKVVIEEQRRSQNEIPGPIKIINCDVIIDELQIARTAAYGGDAVLIPYALNGPDGTLHLLKACQAVNIEAIVGVSTVEDGQAAIDMGASMISVMNVPGADAKVDFLNALQMPADRTVTTIANIMARMDKGLEEVEEAWAVRDKGYHCAWIADALYKAGNSVNEHPGAIVKSMKAKSSLKWASPVAQSGRGEGAREYLGDILM